MDIKAIAAELVKRFSGDDGRVSRGNMPYLLDSLRNCNPLHMHRALEAEVVTLSKN